MSARFNLVMRQWLRGDDHCSVEDLERLVQLGRLSAKDKDEIMRTNR